MKTNFSVEQLTDPDIAEAEAILQTCVHYGFCTNTCPTYVLTRDENESPRGRIDLIKEMLESSGAPKPETVKHLDNCLSCLSCMTTCAAKVDYGHLIDRARVHIEKTYRRPLLDRVMRFAIARTLPFPKRLRAALYLGRFAKSFAGFVPSRLRPLLSLIPGRIVSSTLEPQTFEAFGPRRFRVALLAGCAQQVLNSNINAASIRLLQKYGCDVVVSRGAGCCGSLALHMGREKEAKSSALANIEAWNREILDGGLDAIIVNASGCGTTVKDYVHLFGRDSAHIDAAQHVASRTYDITEFLMKIGVAASDSIKSVRVAYHDPCSMQHGQKVTQEPRELLKRFGFSVQDIAEKHFCCGSAGTYNILQPQTAQILGLRKANNVKNSGANILVTGNIGCMIQISQYLDIPVVHTVELLNWAAGGAVPPALNGFSLDEVPAIADPLESPMAGLPKESDNFW